MRIKDLIIYSVAGTASFFISSTLFIWTSVIFDKPNYLYFKWIIVGGAIIFVFGGLDALLQICKIRNCLLKETDELHKKIWAEKRKTVGLS